MKIEESPQTVMAQEKSDSLEETEFNSLVKKDKKKIVRILAEKIADSPDLKDLWVTNQIEGIKPMIEWDADKLKAVARDYFDWE